MKTLIGVASLLIYASFGCSIEDEKPSWSFRTAVVKRATIEATVQATGTLEPEEVVDVGAQVAGPIQALSVDYGSQVRRGDILAEIDPRVYQIHFEQARARLKRAEAEVKVASAHCKLAEQDWERATRLGEKASAAADLSALKTKIELARASVDVTKGTVLQMQAALDLTKLDLDRCSIRSPMTGLVIDRRVGVGQRVVTGLDAPGLFLVASDLKKLQVWTSVNEADMGQVGKGQEVRFTTDAFPEKVHRGTVTQIRLNATITQNVVTYTVVTSADNPDGKLLPYLTANVQFVVARREHVLTVPNAALRWRPRRAHIAPNARTPPATAGSDEGAAAGRAGADRRIVWVDDKGFVRPVQVRTGLTDGTRTEIIDGDLAEGTTVVIGVQAPEPDPKRSQSLEADAKRMLAGLEVKTLLIQPGTASKGEVGLGAGSVNSLTYADAEAITRECPAVKSAAPVRRARTAVVHGNRSWVPMYIYGTTPSYLEVRDWQDLNEGEPFTDRDVRSRNKVCLLGQSIVRELFDDASPIGKMIRLEGMSFRVIGILRSKGANFMGLDQDDILVTPWTALEMVTSGAKAGAGGKGQSSSTLNALYPAASEAPKPKTAASVDQILVQAASAEDVPAARRQVAELLRLRHRLRQGQPDDFNVRDFLEMMKALKSSAGR